MTERTRLLTFAPMISSEAVRRVLAHHDLDYDEDDHVFFWASLVALFRGSTPIIPLVLGKGAPISSMVGLTDRLDAATPARRLIPAEPTSRAAVIADCTMFLDDLANKVAKVAYSALLPLRDLMLPVFSVGVPPAEARGLARHYGSFAWAMGKALRLTDPNVTAALARTRVIVAGTDARLADGRAWLHGADPTLADIMLAAAMGPLTLPAGSRSPIPPLDAMPPTMQALVTEMRATATGRWVAKVYEGWTR